MSFLGDILDGLGSPQGLVSLGGTLIGANANQRAADTIASSQGQARDAFRQAAQEGQGFIDQGTQQYGQTIAPLLTQQPITLPTFRGLTTQQQLGRDDLMRSGTATLAASGLRGAGRAGIAALTDADNRYVANARAANDATDLTARQTAQQTQNAARTGLANVQASAGTAKANTAIGAGTQIGGSYQNQGYSTGGMQVANGNLYSDALGQISAIGAGASPNAGGYGVPSSIYAQQGRRV